MAMIVIAVLQLLATIGVGILIGLGLKTIATAVNTMASAIERNTSIALDGLDEAAKIKAKVAIGNNYARELHGKEFGYTPQYGDPESQRELPRRRQPSESGYRASARAPSNPDPDELEPPPVRHVKRGDR
jgi:hypothetical protein